MSQASDFGKKSQVGSFMIRRMLTILACSLFVTSMAFPDMKNAIDYLAKHSNSRYTDDLRQLVAIQRQLRPTDWPKSRRR